MTNERYTRASEIQTVLFNINETMNQLSTYISKDNNLFTYNDNTILMKVRNLLTEDLLRAKRDLEIEFNNL